MPIGRRTQLVLSLIVILTMGIALLEGGVYGWTLFTIVPLALGLLASCIARPASAVRAAIVGASTVLGASVVLMIFALEGVICIVMSLPIVLPLGSLGAWLAFQLRQSDFEPQRGVALLVLPVAAIAWDLRAPPPLFHVTTQVVVRATPEQVWPHVISFPELPEAREWLFRTG